MGSKVSKTEGLKLNYDGINIDTYSVIPQIPFMKNGYHDSILNFYNFNYFPPIKTYKDELLGKILKEKIKEISIEDESYNNLVILWNNIKSVVEETKSTQLRDFGIISIHPVGSLAMGSLIKSQRLVECIILTNRIPFIVDIPGMSFLINHQLIQRYSVAEDRWFQFSNRSDGFIISSDGFSVYCRLTTFVEESRHPSKLLMESKLVCKNRIVLCRSVWVHRYSPLSCVSSLIRIFEILKNRFPELRVLNQWMIILLGSVSALQNRKILPLDVAFRNCFKLLSSGIFLTGSMGLSDPLNSSPSRIHEKLTVKQADDLCLMSQYILNYLSLREYNIVIGDVDERFKSENTYILEDRLDCSFSLISTTSDKHMFSSNCLNA